MTSPAPRSASYLMIETQEGVGWDAWQALAARAEAAGLGGLVVSDHYLSPSDPELGCLDAWAVLAALAQATRRLRLGTLVSPVTFRHPAVLARLAQTVDQISGGRVDVGLGAGWSTEEHAAFAFPFPDLAGRLALLEEQTAIVRALLDGEVVDGAGPAYPLVAGRLRPRPVQARVPLVLGGAARPRMARLAARCADEYNLVYDPPAACAGARERLDAACAAVGRDPATLPMTLMTRAVVGRDAAEVRERLAHGGAPPPTDEQRAIWLVGTIDEVLEQIATFRAAGVVGFRFQQLDHDDLDHIDLLGELAARL